MATPIGYINGKPVSGPPRPPSMSVFPLPPPIPGAFMPQGALAYPLDGSSSAPIQLGGMPVMPTLHVDMSGAMAFHPDGTDEAFDAFEEQHRNPLTSLKIWPSPPANLRCPASVNGWYHEDGATASRNKAWNGTSNRGLFDKLPLELREKIYSEAVVLRRSKQDSRQLDWLESGDCRAKELFRLDALSHWKDGMMIFPGGRREACVMEEGQVCLVCEVFLSQTRPIHDNLGLLLSNKQINNEVSKVFYSQNTFAVVIDISCPGRTFWNCGHRNCQSPGSPCLIAPQNLAYIKHLSIAIRGGKFTGPFTAKFSEELALLKGNLQQVVTVLRKLNVKLKTLDICYAGIWNREVESLLTCPLEFGPSNIQRALIRLPETTIGLVRTRNGDEYFEGPMGRLLPIEHGDIFGPLRKLKGRVEYCTLHGDLPTKYLQYMREKMDKDADPSVPIKMLRAREEKAEAERMQWRREVIRRRFEQERAAREAAEEDM